MLGDQCTHLHSWRQLVHNLFGRLPTLLHLRGRAGGGGGGCVGGLAGGLRTTRANARDEQARLLQQRHQLSIVARLGLVHDADALDVLVLLRVSAMLLCSRVGVVGLSKGGGGASLQPARA